MDLELHDARIVITGASKGIGAAVAAAFAKEGAAHLHLVARAADDLETVAVSCRALGSTVTTHVVDLSTEDGRSTLLSDAPSIDVLVNCAGAIPQGTIDSLDLERWRTSWELKVWGYIALCQGYRSTIAQNQGAIINIVGTGGDRPDPRYIAGSTANAALMALSRALGATSMDDGFRVVCVNPGPVATERLEHALRERAVESLGDGGRWTETLDGFPGHRIAQPSEVADLVAFLASRRSSYISGTIVTIDGGLTQRGGGL